jgi:hypothetical protein
MERLTAAEREEWGEEVGRGGVPAGRHLSKSQPTACKRGVWLLGRTGEVARILLTPKKAQRFCQGAGWGEQMEKLGRYLRKQKPNEEEEGCGATSTSRWISPLILHPHSLGGLEKEGMRAERSAWPPLPLKLTSVALAGFLPSWLIPVI